MAYKLIYLARRAKTVSWEDWPRTWKSHAIFASQFPAMAGTIDWMRYNVRVDGPRFAALPVSMAHDGVCAAQSHDLATLRGEGFLPGQRALIDADELRVFDRYTPDFTFWCSEQPIREGPIGEAAIFRFLSRRSEVSRAAFDLELQGIYRDAAAADGFRCQRQVLNTTIEPPPPDFPFEAIEECWFASAEDAACALEHAATSTLVENLASACDPARIVTMLTRPTHRWPKT
jgi:hypothetical protein